MGNGDVAAAHAVTHPAPPEDLPSTQRIRRIAGEALPPELAHLMEGPLARR